MFPALTDRTDSHGEFRIMKIRANRPGVLLVLLLASFATANLDAQEAALDFTADGRLMRPENYRTWAFVTSGLGMTYGPARPDSGQPPAFTNVFVNPDAYAAFNESGQWPDGTFFLLEVRASEENVSINSGGRTQGAQFALEAAVKDSSRYPDGGWAYFDLGPPGEAVAPLPRTASCYSCHSEHGAVDWTFTQFYPDLFRVAEELGTVRADYDPERALSE